ncbi:MAG: hypothetical protein MJZ02_09700 [Paludibacteraceae bacterium]|nr:hypothetical protein [Paludibacteraceae bacterium]
MKKILLLLTMLSCTLLANAIKVRPTGDLTFLKSVKQMEVQFTYDNMIVGSMTEDAYVNKKVGEYNAKEAGRGDNWYKVWESDKQNVYPISFLELLEKSCNIKECKNGECEYLMIVNTSFFEPGFNVGIMRRDAEISVTCKIVKKSDPSQVVAEITVLHSPGRTAMGYDYSVASRVTEAYAKAGKEVGRKINKAK